MKGESLTSAVMNINGMENKMAENLISKKKLLEKYNISYGALYRWKRKGLIPDDWFIKKSTPTGQETFFPERLICKRVEKILKMKDDVLLDELASTLSGEEKKNEFIAVDTAYGEKTFKLSDISAIYAVDEEGNRRDITDGVRALFAKRTASPFGIFKKKN